MSHATIPMPTIRIERDHGAEAWTFSLTEFRGPDAGARIFLTKVADDDHSSIERLALAASLIMRAEPRPDLDSKIRYLTITTETQPWLNRLMILSNGGSHDPKVQSGRRVGA